jgi:hypothetical protein
LDGLNSLPVECVSRTIHCRGRSTPPV